MNYGSELKNWKVKKVKQLASLKIRKLKLKSELKAQKSQIKLNIKIEKVKQKADKKTKKLERKLRKLEQKLKRLGQKRQESPNAKKSHLSKITVPSYSLAEELVNSISHGVAAVFAIAALILCVVKAQTPIAITSSAIYGTFMIILYVISCIYHALSSRILGKKVLRILDHIDVMLMVAGTYTPICLSLIGGWLGWLIFAIVWIITIIAVVFNAINVDKYQYVSVACNLILGWGSLLILPQLLEVCPLSGILIFLVGGGAVYSIGSVLYVIGAKRKYIHSVFHFFVIAASVLHFLFIYLYCI